MRQLEAANHTGGVTLNVRKKYGKLHGKIKHKPRKRRAKSKITRHIAAQFPVSS